jgi:hypothetical protein
MEHHFAMSNVIKLPSLMDRTAAQVERMRQEHIAAIDDAISAAWAALPMGPDKTRKVVSAIIERLDGSPLPTRKSAKIKQVPITSPTMRLFENALSHIGGKLKE